MRENRNTLSAYDASEGSLFLFFVAALALSPTAPVFFSIDNVDQALNPSLVKKLTRLFCDWIIQKNRQQIICTTHNPAAVNGLDLEDDRIRLFTVSRNNKGHSQIQRVLPLPGGLTMPGCIRDAAPDAWGRRVIINEMLGLKGSDLYSVVKAEYIAMRLAELAGLNVAPVKLAKAANKDVLLIERFDRIEKGTGWERKAMVSALTLFGLDEMMARYASYETLSENIRHRFTNPGPTLKEMFSRLVFNILCGNTDDSCT